MIVERNSQATGRQAGEAKKTGRHRLVSFCLSGLAFVVFGVLLVAITDTAVV
jgi:hypothetical protein